MDFDSEEEDLRPFDRRDQDGQGVWPITLAAAVAIVFAGIKDPYSLPIPDVVIDGVKAVFSSAVEPPKEKVAVVSPADCALVPVSHSPAAMMVMAEKFPQAGCEPKQK